ncbi:MAG: hypothetical protein AAB133_05615 [Pseudomonadota bacterium]
MSTNLSLSDRLNTICLERIRVATARTNSPSSVFDGPVAQGFTAAQAAFDPGFRYGEGEDGTAEWSSMGLFLLLSFLARSSSSTNAGPVYLSLFWSQADQNWAPNRLFTEYLLNFNAFF